MIEFLIKTQIFNQTSVLLLEFYVEVGALVC